MKKIITIFISLLALPALGEEGSKPITKFNPTDSALFCQVDISPLEIKSINGYDVITSIDCYQSTEVGKPSLPVRSFFVLLPAYTEVKNMTITSVEQLELDGRYNLKPLSPPIPISKGFTTTEIIFQGEDFYPENILRLDSIQKLRGYSIACISVFGAGYNPKTKQLIWNKQVNFKLNLATPKIKAMGSSGRGIREDEELVKELVVNPELTDTYTHVTRATPLLTTYKYVVITTQTLTTAFAPLCASKSMTATIATTSWIYEQYPGKDEQEKIKAFINDYYGTYGTCYVLLGGDVNIVPYRGVYAWVSGAAALKTDEYEDKNIPCDLYYTCFDKEWDWDTDNDGIYGELNDDDIDLSPEVWIGRAPVNNPAEATNFVNKVITCENLKDNYIYNELLIAYILYNKYPYFCDGKEIMEDIAYYTPGSYIVYKEYQTMGGVDNGRIINYINSGVGLIAHANHANWWTATPFEIVSEINVKTLNNGSKTFIFNTIGCIAGDFSKTDCIGEEMLLNQNGGAVAFIGNSRYGWFDESNVKKYSGEYQIEFFKKFFKEGYSRLGETLGKSKMEFIGECGTNTPYRWIMFCLNLLGDPAMEFRGTKEIFCIDQTIEDVINEPEKPIDLVITLKNLKQGTITNVYGTISTNDPYITIIKDNASFGNIPPEGTSSGSYTIQVNSNYPSIQQVFFQLEIGGDGGYKNMDKFSLVINLKINNLVHVFVYPNPCYPNKGQIFKIANIPLNSNPKVYIYSLTGELVRVLDEEGSEIKTYPGSAQAIWDAKNDKGKNVASGIYIYLLKCDVGTKKGKMAIIR